MVDAGKPDPENQTSTVVTVDLNCDLGESSDDDQISRDDEIMTYVSSVNIACAFHAGDPTVMHKAVDSALAKDVAIGAHPSFLDRLGFGRREMQLSSQEVFDIVVYQISALAGFVSRSGGKLHHVKPHGALYNMAAKDKDLAQAIAKAVYAIDPNLILYGLSGSQLIIAGKEMGLKTANEVFADRTYQEDGSLTPRSQPHCLIDSVEQSVKQALLLVQDRKVKALSGKKINLNAETICIHGDHANALDLARKLKAAFRRKGIAISTL